MGHIVGMVTSIMAGVSLGYMTLMSLEQDMCFPWTSFEPHKKPVAQVPRNPYPT